MSGNFKPARFHAITAEEERSSEFPIFQSRGRTYLSLIRQTRVLARREETNPAKRRNSMRKLTRRPGLFLVSRASRNIERVDTMPGRTIAPLM